MSVVFAEVESMKHWLILLVACRCHQVLVYVMLLLNTSGSFVPRQVLILFPDAILRGNVEPEMFTCMAYNSQGIIAGGNDNYFRLFAINNNGIAIDKVID